MSRELEIEREMFSKALHNAVYEIIEMFCLEAEAKHGIKGDV